MGLDTTRAARFEDKDILFLIRRCEKVSKKRANPIYLFRLVWNANLNRVYVVCC